MENRVALSLSPSLSLPLQKMKLNSPQNTPHRRKTLLFGWEVQSAKEFFALSVIMTSAKGRFKKKKNVLFDDCLCLSSGTLKWCQNSLLINCSVRTVESNHTFWSATSLLFTAICHKWCSTSTWLGHDNSGLNRDTGSIQLLWMFGFSHSVMIEVELSMPGLCNETYLPSCLKNSVIWLHADWFFPNKEFELPRWRFLTNCWQNRMLAKQQWLTEIWQRGQYKKIWQPNRFKLHFSFLVFFQL